jgi:hypothetical protein
MLVLLGTRAYDKCSVHPLVLLRFIRLVPGEGRHDLCNQQAADDADIRPSKLPSLPIYTSILRKICSLVGV